MQLEQNIKNYLPIPLSSKPREVKRKKFVTYKITNIQWRMRVKIYDGGYENQISILCYPTIDLPTETLVRIELDEYDEVNEQGEDIECALLDYLTFHWIGFDLLIDDYDEEFFARSDIYESNIHRQSEVYIDDDFIEKVKQNFDYFKNAVGYTTEEKYVEHPPATIFPYNEETKQYDDNFDKYFKAVLLD